MYELAPPDFPATQVRPDDQDDLSRLAGFRFRSYIFLYIRTLCMYPGLVTLFRVLCQPVRRPHGDVEPISDPDCVIYCQTVTSARATFIRSVNRQVTLAPLRTTFDRCTADPLSPPTMHRIPHQQVPTPWSAPFPAAAAAPPGPAQQLPSPPNTASDRGSPPAGSITRRPKFDQKTGRQAGEDIFVCWLTPAPPSRFGPKFRAWQCAKPPCKVKG